MDEAKRARLEKIFNRILKDVKPSELEIKSTIANTNEIMSRLKKIVPNDVELRVVGSIARSTNLAGDSDIDIFMLFDKRYSEEELERLGLEYAKKIVNKKKNESYEIKYAEHPYVRLHLNDIGINIDLVPAYKIENIEEMGTTVDRSPLHTEFLNKHLTEKQRDEIRVLKFFLKMHDIYGAEVEVKGFSGYLCELLVYSFGSLIELFEQASKFKLPLVIIPAEKKVLNDEQTAKRFNSQFVVIDPVDKNRNVAGGVAIESLAKFVILARMVLEKPTLKLFYGKGFSSKEAPKLVRSFEKESGLKPILIILDVPEKSNDIIWPQLNKASKILASMLEKEGIRPYVSNQWVDKKKGFILYFFPNDLSRARLVKGPNVFVGNYSNEFIKKHRKSLGLILAGQDLYALEKRPPLEEIIKRSVKKKELNSSKNIKLRNSTILSRIPRIYAEKAYIAIIKKISL
ncbi:MAG: CCA tRNA nucleotidyltransferase [Candidatus Micrarchaeia archaeon]|jgi:tRNA nucleotidyltransferase (CCA-adding enzyme)